MLLQIYVLIEIISISPTPHLYRIVYECYQNNKVYKIKAVSLSLIYIE